MKKIILDKLVSPYLAWCARRIIRLNKPIVVGVTGSVGKSSTKEAIFHVLKSRFSARENKGNLNNQIGLPLAVIGDINPKSNFGDWFKVLTQSLKLIFAKTRSYPKILVLEMAVDRPGDMQYLISLAPCDIGVITNIGVSHMAFFKNEAKILKEKSRILKNLPENGLAVINFDDPLLRSLRSELKGKTLAYGFRLGADIRATEMKIGHVENLGEGISLAQGTSLRVTYNAVFLPLNLPFVISKAQAYSALAAITVGAHFGLNLVEMATALKSYKPLPGRMQIIRGKRGNIIIDDTYNAAPNSVKIAIETLALVKSKKKTIILGDMLELGPAEELSHKELAKMIHPVAGKVILVGKRTLATHRALRKLGFPKDKIFHFRLVTHLENKIDKIVGKGEVVLVKGSQGLRMEKAVEMLTPESEWPNLTRQDEEWKKKPVVEA